MFFHKAIVTICSQVGHQPSDIRRFWFGVSLLSPHRPIVRNGKSTPQIPWKYLYGERIPQRPTPRHLRATDRPRMRNPTCQQLPWCPAHGHKSDVARRGSKRAVTMWHFPLNSSSESISISFSLTGRDSTSSSLRSYLSTSCPL